MFFSQEPSLPEDLAFHAHREREAPDSLEGNPLSVRTKLWPQWVEIEQDVEQSGATQE